MKGNTFIEHKEVSVVYEKDGPINMKYNTLLITPKTNVVS
jgi:hypothetical protein